MRGYWQIGIVALLAASCSKEQQSSLFAPSIDSAASEYAHALADGTLDGYLSHDQQFQNALLLARSSVPSDMWANKETELRTAQKNQIQQTIAQFVYGPDSGACYLVIRPGSAVTTKEIRAGNGGMWQVFYNVSYADDHASPVITLATGKSRFFHSAVFDVQFQQVAADQNSNSSAKIVAQPNCALVDGTLTTWPVPPLTADQAMQMASQVGAFASQYTTNVNGVAGLSSDQNWSNWDQFVGAAQLLRATLEKHGWTVAGFQPQQMYYYDIRGNITPPAEAQQYIVGGFVGWGNYNGYKVVLLDHGDAQIGDFNAQEDTATATFTVHLTGCTVFCELWKDTHSLPYDLGRYVFADWDAYHNSSLTNLDNVTTNTTVNFVWDPPNGWRVQR